MRKLSMPSNFPMLLRAGVIVLAAGGMGACSTVSGWMGSEDTAPADTAQTADNANVAYPDVNSVPAKPKPTTTQAENQQISDSLISDRDHTQYSADVLKGGGEPAAAPPPPEPPHDDVSLIDQKGSDADAASAPTVAPQGALPAPPPDAPADQAAAASSPAPASAPQPAVPAVQTASAVSATPAMRPSTAQSTASSSAASSAVVPASYAPQKSTLGLHSGQSPVATIVFAGNGTVFTPTATADIQAVAATYKTQGAHGYVHVVGHAAPQSADPLAAFRQSQASANAVAQALIKAGVPAKSVLVETASDTQGGNRRAEIFFDS